MDAALVMGSVYYFRTKPRRQLATCDFSFSFVFGGELVMPYINVQITQGASKEQKAQLIKEFTQTLASVLGKRPEHTHIVIQEIAEENWGFEGLPTDEWRKRQMK
jgi:4-oxalocrotonate tautomerase